MESFENVGASFCGRKWTWMNMNIDRLAEQNHLLSVLCVWSVARAWATFAGGVPIFRWEAIFAIPHTHYYSQWSRIHNSFRTRELCENYTNIPHPEQAACLQIFDAAGMGVVVGGFRCWRMDMNIVYVQWIQPATCGRNAHAPSHEHTHNTHNPEHNINTRNHEILLTISM